MLNAEIDDHLAGDASAGNRRNCYGAKTVLIATGAFHLQVPRERLASFDPQLIAK